MSRFEAVDKCFSKMFETDIARLYAGEMLVARSVRREEEQDGVTTPVWILVTEGRGIVSTSRFLYRVVGAWVEAFAAPDYLLRQAYLDELQAAVSRALDAPVTVSRERVFAPGNGFKAGQLTFLQPPGSPPDAITAVISDAARESAQPVFVCGESDHAAARAMLAAGCAEYGRMARLKARR